MLPEGTGPFPVVVMAGGWCYVKELRQPQYAQEFVERGFAALIFDYRHMGASDGEPRQHIDPWAQIEDYQNAVTWVENQPELDSNRIGAWGISYSGGHVLILGAIDPRVKVIVSNVPVMNGYETMWRVHGTEVLHVSGVAFFNLCAAMLAVVAVGFVFIARRYRYHEESKAPSGSPGH